MRRRPGTNDALRMTQKPLSGSTALVTGGAVRVGRAISQALAREGAQVIVHYNSSEGPAESLVREIEASGGKAARIPADLSDISEVQRLAEEAETLLGPIDILINNASTFPPEELATVTPELWDQTIATNLRAPFFLTQIVGGKMKSRGSGVIINMADLAGLQAWSGYAAHGISKAGLIHLTKVAARALAPEVRVAGIAPGTVMPPEDLPEREIQALADRTPLKRNGSAEDVAEAILFLVRSGFITGEVIAVDGGRLLR